MEWLRLGLNAQNEWIEECASRRRVRTASGLIPEIEGPPLRFGRLKSADDARLLAHILSYPHTFRSYGSAHKAFEVWTGQSPASSPKEFVAFKKQVEQALAERVWRCVVHGHWSEDMPDWNNALQRPAYFSWPMGLELGLRRLYPKQTFARLHDFSSFLSQEIQNKKLRITEAPLQAPISSVSGVQVCLSDRSYVVEHAHLHASKVSLTEWSGSRPPMVEKEHWQSAYVPFSSLTSEPTGYVSPLLYQALSKRMEGVKASDMQESVLRAVGRVDNLSLDQIDAVWMALEQLKQKQSFLLADETGYGKGRVLAAICQAALLQDVQVLFITEKKTLFSDFFRDCSYVFSASVPELCLLHANAKVVNSKGEKIQATNVKVVPQNTPWVWSTYSQFNRQNKSKIDSVLDWMRQKKTWVVLDEMQNAAGSSTTAEVIAQFTKQSAGNLFSSATFAKNEEQLEAYRPLFSGSQKDWNRLRASFGQAYTVRSAVTLEWAEQGRFLRREHPPMSLPDEVWIDGPEVRVEHQKFAQWWQQMYVCATQWPRHPNETIWMRLGAPMSRALREFSMLQKNRALVDFVQQCHRQEEKVVVVSDWTLSSHVQRLITKDRENVSVGSSDPQEQEEIVVPAKGLVLSQKPLWKDSWVLVVKELFPDELLQKVPASLAERLSSVRQQALEALLALPDWSVSPFDELMNALTQSNLKVGEISGRSWKVEQNAGQWSIMPQTLPPRTQTIASFNSGDLDVLLLTRAGNSGVSLHAGQTFKDQKRRHLVEWDVSPDPSVRLQFWGRVRRKDQVSEPKRSTLLIDSSFERKRQEGDIHKQNKILSHSGTLQQPHRFAYWGQKIAHQWSLENRPQSKVMNIAYEPDLGKMMSRCVILKDQDQAAMLSFVQQGLDLLENLNVRSSVWNAPSRVNRSMWWWGGPSKALYWQERVWPLVQTAPAQVVSQAIQNPQLVSGSHLASMLPPHSALSRHTTILSRLSKGAGLLVMDPSTGQRVRSVCLGLEKPSLWSIATTKVHLWLTTHSSPLITSVMALLDETMLEAQFMDQPASLNWFSGEPAPVHAMVLMGPAWSVASWGERYAPDGELCHMLNEDGTTSWGWRMPQECTWNDVLTFPLELGGVEHVKDFLKRANGASLTWTWSPSETIVCTPQADGVFVEGSADVFEERVIFPIRRHAKRLISTPEGFKMILPWGSVHAAFASWINQGASPNIPASFRDFHARLKWD